MKRSRMAIPLLIPWLWFVSPTAVHADSACPEGAACVWDRPDFAGNRATVSRRGCIDSNIRSAINRTDAVLYLYLNGGCVGAQAATVAPGEGNPRVNAASATANCSGDVVDSCGDDTTPPPSPAGAG